MFIGDRYVLKKTFDKLCKVGYEYEIANFVDGKIVLRDARTRVASCCITEEELNEYFDCMENKEKHTWTEWTEILEDFNKVRAFYRSNNKKVQVRMLLDGKFIRSEATCCKDDKFSLEDGIRIAYFRCRNKLIKSYYEEYLDNKKILKELTK